MWLFYSTNKIMLVFKKGKDFVYCVPFDFLVSLVHKELEMQLSYILKGFLIKVDADDH